MNENINLIEILKNCPKGTMLYSPIFGEGEFLRINNDDSFPVVVISEGGIPNCFDATGKTYYNHNKGECLLFPSKDQRDWSKFKPKKPKFDPKTLNPFDKVLVRDHNDETWSCNFFSHIREVGVYKFTTITSSYKQVIPYNDDTKHLARTTNEAPEYYKYWED